ncbi:MULTISPECIES: hypothetical protein [unclassified Mesorhizobium]|nr:MULTISPECIES: hypothetical protein [unclassified Mesorhizobium]
MLLAVRGTIPAPLLSNTLLLAEARKVKLASDKSQSMKVQIAFD